MEANAEDQTGDKPAPAFLSPVDASKYIKNRYGISLGTASLASMRVEGSGPAFRRFGVHPVYDRAELDRFMTERLSEPVSSTAAYNSPRRRQRYPRKAPKTKINAEGA